VAHADFMISDLTSQIAQLSKEKATYAAIALEKELENRKLTQELKELKAGKADKTDQTNKTAKTNKTDTQQK
jgi:hypothetical protein